MASFIIATDDSADQTSEMSTPGKTRCSSISVAHRSHEHTRDEVNIVKILGETPAAENEHTKQHINEVEAQRDSPGHSSEQAITHCEHSLKQALEAALTVKDLRGRVSFLESSLAELRGANKLKPALDAEDVVYDLSQVNALDKSANSYECSALQLKRLSIWNQRVSHRQNGITQSMNRSENPVFLLFP